MRALKLKIRLDKLLTENWHQWSEVDQVFIHQCAISNHCDYMYEPEEDVMVFHGNPGDLYNFMYDVAYRYDIEII